jgi:hypothetical protein
MLVRFWLYAGIMLDYAAVYSVPVLSTEFQRRKIMMAKCHISNSHIFKYSLFVLISKLLFSRTVTGQERYNSLFISGKSKHHKPSRLCAT